MSVKEVRELTAAELKEVVGGWVVPVVVLGAGALFGFGVALPGTDFVEEGKKYLEGKGGKL